MGWTIFWAAVGGLCQGAVSWLGWAMNHDTISPTRRKWAHLGFVAFTVIGMFSIGIVTYRAGRSERAHFKTVPISNVYQRVPLVPFDFLPVGDPLSFNINYENVGSGPAVNAALSGRASLQVDASSASEDAAIADFQVRLKVSPPSQILVAKGETGYFTAHGPSVSATDRDDVINSIKVIYVVGAISFSDDFGTHVQHICRHMEPPNVSSIETWAACSKWTDEVDH